MTALRLARLDLEEPPVRAGHELRGDGGPVGTGGEVGDVALQPGQGPGLRLVLAVDALGRAVEGDEPVPLDRGEAGDGPGGLGDLLVDPMQGPPYPVGLVLVVDDLVPALGGGPGGPGLGENVPVGDVLAGVLAPSLADDVGNVRDLHAEDERQPGGLDRLLLRPGDHARVRDHGDIGQPVSRH
jgi:hypothetical protein